MQRRQPGRASGYSPSAGPAATLAQRPGPPRHGSTCHGEAPGEPPAGPSAGTTQVTQGRHHRLRSVLHLSPERRPLKPDTDPALELSGPASHVGTNETRAFAHVGAAASDQWDHAAEGEGQAGAAVDARDARTLPPFHSVSREELGPQRGGARVAVRFCPFAFPLTGLTENLSH